ncbi:hypothetical protein BC834DRAFT_845144 [Gloeopeniophorella convolvens]|nr:hypothetical protein BC834DRAFT_845144 [Gloeopeniophorella convolvens]
MPDAELVTKRLHISGLTPAITADDLSRRLGTFGSVTALDGLGKLDVLGQPRRFAYVTLQSTKPQLSRCMNVLSGSTWKGAKLRIGEAKPDYHARIMLENAPSEVGDDARPGKRRRLARGVQGKHAKDMSLITHANVHQHPQWRITPLGRLVRSVRMRPAHPLDPPLDAVANVKNLGKGTGKEKKRKRARDPPTRARRQTIDPLRWGSTHIKGVFLESAQTSLPTSTGVRNATVDSSEDKADEVVEYILDVDEDETYNIGSPDPAPHPRSPSPHRAVSSLTAATLGATEGADLAAETSKTLDLLNSMFGEVAENWGGAENVDSDAEKDTHRAQTYSPTHRSDDAMDIEIVPAERFSSQHGDKRDLASGQVESAALQKSEPVPPPPAQPVKLKDLFAPREEEAGFSLLGHLDLDSELDFDLDEPAFQGNASVLPAHTSAHEPGPVAVAEAAPHIQSKSLDSSLPFFFPQAGYVRRVKFARTEDEEEIRQRWEAARGELTRDWKRRHREAVKSRKRRGGERVE